jgi:hypothetical protein
VLPPVGMRWLGGTSSACPTRAIRSLWRHGSSMP